MLITIKNKLLLKLFGFNDPPNYVTASYKLWILWLFRYNKFVYQFLYKKK